MEDGSGKFLHSKEDVTQGNPLAMNTYDIGVLPLISEIRVAHNHVTHPWYTDEAGAGGTLEHILAHFQDMQARGLPRGYFPEPTKIILVMAPRNVPRAEKFFRGMGVKIVTGSRYLRGFVGDRAQRRSGWPIRLRDGQSP